MDAMMQEDEESEINCAKLKEKAHDRKLASLRKNNLPSGRKHWGGGIRTHCSQEVGAYVNCNMYTITNSSQDAF